MELFNLPNATKVFKVIPKNAFDTYTNSKQKKMFTDLIARITWLNKLSPDTVNLESREIKEIQLFKVELKLKEEVQPVLDIINKAIPYHIIFIVEQNESIYLSTSVKHNHPVNEDNSVVDWTFKTPWFKPSQNKYSIQLKKSLDAAYHDFCLQISAMPELANKSLTDLVQYNKQLDTLKREIVMLQNSIKNCKLFKLKVEFNLLLKKKEMDLELLLAKTNSN
jgi:Domain of unknown function (DUF4391)